MARTYRSRLGRQPSKLRINIVPILSVILGSMITTLPIITDFPILPPMGLLVLLAWRLIRPGMWPVWVAFPLGLIDDIFSGQPIGSAAFLWSAAFIFLEIVDRRTPERDYWQDWLIAIFVIVVVIACGMLLIDFKANLPHLDILIPQMLISALSYLFVARIVGAIDHWRTSA